MITSVDEMLDGFAHYLSDAMLAHGLTGADIDAIITSAKERVQGEIGEESEPLAAESMLSDVSLENGIFNLTVHLVHHYETTMPAADARAQAAVYLEKIVAGLRNFEQKAPTP